MADAEQLSLLRRDSDAWNAWREQNPDLRPDLSGADLHGADLLGAKLNGAELTHADLTHADLGFAFLRGANLSGARLVATHLTCADLTGATIIEADLSDANLTSAYLTGADLTASNLAFANLGSADFGGADLTNVRLSETVFANVDLSGVKGLHTCIHRGASIVDHRTLQQSGALPVDFLRGCGWPDELIEYLATQPIQFYSCFISYSSKDDEFARRLHAELQDRGIRCWFAPEDMKIGEKIADAIESAIGRRDKLLLILSENSIASAWVPEEVRTALAEEERHGRPVLFPVRLDDTVMETTEQWAYDVRRRHIGDFRDWKDHDGYCKAFERLLRDLTVEAET